PCMQLQQASGDRRTDEGAVRAGRWNHSRLDGAELSAADVRNRIRKARVIEDIVSICANSEVHALGDGDVLQDAEVRVEVVRATERVPRNVAEIRFGSNPSELRT